MNDDVHLNWVRGEVGIMTASTLGWIPSSCCRYTVEGEPWTPYPDMTTWRAFEQWGNGPKEEMYYCHSTGDETSTMRRVEHLLTLQRRKWAWARYMESHWPPEDDDGETV